MKITGRRFVAVLLAAATVLGTGVGANAATRASYTATVKNKELIFTRNGEKLSPYEMKTTDIKLLIDDDDDLLVCFTDPKGKFRGISLGDQREIEVGGDIRSLTLASSLGGRVDVTVDNSADINTMTVDSKNNVEIQGDVASLVVKGAADIEVTGSSTVSLARIVSSYATLLAKGGTDVKRVLTVNRANVSGSGVGTKSYIADGDYYGDRYYYDDYDYWYYYNRHYDEDYYYDRYYDDYRTELDYDAIDVYVNNRSDDLYLDDIEYKLEDEVEAVGYNRRGSDRTLRGDYRWSDPDKMIFDASDPESKTFSCKFRFSPDNSDYPSVSGTIRVRVHYER